MEMILDIIYLLVRIFLALSLNILANVHTGTTHPYPDDTFYSVGRVPRKLLMKYLGVKMYLVRLKEPPLKVADKKTCANIATLMLGSAGVCSPQHLRQAQN